jgi:hypothetical protein
VDISCTLPPVELRARKAALRDELAPAVISVEERPHGFRFWFDSTAERLAQLARFIAFEKDCCAFLDFRMAARAGASRVSLDIDGPEGAKATIEALFVDSIADPTSR